MINIKIDGVEGVKRGLSGMANSVPQQAGIMLDRAAQQTRERMSDEAPKGRTGRLSSNITIRSLGQYVREIKPEAKNLSGGTYALPVESGHGPGYIPNVGNIGKYYAVSPKVAWAIALSIQRQGVRANPFVTRTLGWVRGQIEKNIPPFISGIVANYVKG